MAYSVRIVEFEGGKAAIVDSGERIIYDGQSALDVIMDIGYTYECRRIVLRKEAIAEAFFDLATGVAGEIAQKFANYRYQVAVIGDFSRYGSKALQDYMYECNLGGPLYFVGSEEEALGKLRGD